MELVEVSLTPLQRRAGAVWVPWSDLAAQQQRRGQQVKALTRGESVMLRLDGGVVHRGRVLRTAFAGDDGAYVIVVGPRAVQRIPSQADRRTRPVVQQRGEHSPARPAAHDAGPTGEPRVQDVVIRVVPAQRRAQPPEPPSVNLYL